MVRQNPSDLLFLGASQEELESTGGTQFDVDVFGAWQKSEEQAESFFERQVSRPPFAWITRCDDEGRSKPGNFLFKATRERRKRIQTKLKEVRRSFHCNGRVEIGRGRDNGHELRPGSFDRSSRCNIVVNFESADSD